MIINILLIAILSAASVPYTPWYFGAFIALVICYLRPQRLDFLSGFLGVAVAWMSWIFYFHFSNNGIISNKMAMIFTESLGEWVNAPILIIISILIGAIVGGMGALSGHLLKQAFLTNPNKAKRNKKTYKLKIQ